MPHIPSSTRWPWPRLGGIVFVLLGLALAAGGAWLAALGGSWYYLLAGLGALASGVLLLKERARALGSYALVLAATAVWAVAEVGFDWWQLVPRLALWLVLGLFLLLPPLRRQLWGRTPAWALPAAVLLSVGVLAASLFTDRHDRLGQIPDASMAAQGYAGVPGTREQDWTAYGRSDYGDRYAPATQITPQNVGRLEQAWVFHTGDFKGESDPGEIANEVTPLKANDMLYLCTPHNIVIALDPDTGKEIWRHDPKINRDAKTYQHMICRGVAYYDATLPQNALYRPAAAVDATAAAAVARACPRRIYAPTADATVIALNADTGQPCSGFGSNGVIDLKISMGHVVRGFLNPTSPPSVGRRTVVVASSVTDNYSTDEPSGVIRGYDVDTGQLLWNWDSGNPDATEPFGPGQTYTRNSPNSWSVSSIDSKLGLVYLPMGNQTPDIWGGNRLPEGERFNSAIVALDLDSGKLRWVYQTVHHDLWDMDIGGQPTLVDLDRPEGKVPALLASTKRGDIYVIDRRDGKLLVAAPEQPVPQGAAEGDRTSPTQPFSELSFKPERLRERDMWGTTPFDQLACRIIFRGLRYDGIFTPPSEQGSLVYPGNYGVFDWGGITVDPVRQVMVGNPNYVAFVSRLHRRGTVDAKGGSGTEQGLQPMTGTPFAVDLHPLLSPLGIPCQAPPWGYMAAVDLKTMQIAWMRKNGTVIDSAPLPIPLPLGVPSLAGAITTGGGVAFMSATLDAYLRAYDVRNGKLLWQQRLPAGGQATPMSYVSDKTGRQYVVQMAGGHGSLGTKMGDALIAYALPAGAK
ncbi:membrane-bound PQQ-dependent dehydrogenase, glucose/quinate/shikimate family [Xylophilus sp. GW821-FHT01B05]